MLDFDSATRCIQDPPHCGAPENAASGLPGLLDKRLRLSPDVDPFVSEVTIDERLPTGKDLVTPIDYYPGGGHLTIFKGKPKPGNAPAKGRDLSCKDNNGYCTMVIDDEYSAELQRVGKALTMDDVRHILRELKVIPSLNDLNTWKPLS